MKAAEKIKTLEVKSPAFSDRTIIPPVYTHDGRNINPPLTIGNIPHETKSLALIIEDPDAPRKTSFVHWLMWNIPPAPEIVEDSVPGFQGKNDFGNLRYDGPAPPSGTHRYFFKVYALDSLLKLKAGASRSELEKTMATHIIGYGDLTGLYGRAL
ncbi:MAG TPA: YbhB/YbcL family Raf kinase inhibitor-like protein [Bacteroidia bacterium]|nr:YbhB/YbcL family Raf kinase inhibitor-like protein [Bacteroidia bacterium]